MFCLLDLISSVCERQVYGPYLLLIPPEKMVVITIDTVCTTLCCLFLHAILFDINCVTLDW